MSSSPYIIIKYLKSQDISESTIRPTDATDMHCYRLPNEARGIEQIELLTDKLLLGYISEGAFYLVDLGQATNNNNLQIALEIRIPGAHIG